ncbi:alpha-galactosidase [Opitutaceae bacterium TAV3]|nr:alpha-galactosidase [Opitutaceae bacterium TAV3]
MPLHLYWGPSLAADANIEHPTSNAQHPTKNTGAHSPAVRSTSTLAVERSAFDVRRECPPPPPPPPPAGLDALVRTGDRAFSPTLAGAPWGISLDTLPLEYPVHGTSDFREPALEVYQPANGSRILDLRYKTHRITPGKPALAGLPATFTRAGHTTDAETLTLVLADALTGLEVELLYTAFAAHPIITRSARITNHGKATLEIRRALSASLDFSTAHDGHQFIQLSGAWARERDVIATPLRQGRQTVDSRRGTSSHQQNPFIALAQHGTDENRGDVYAFNLVYSGNWMAQAELESARQVRAQIGINPFDFAWQLAPGDSFQTPEAVLVHVTDGGLGGMSRALHRFYRAHLLRGHWHDKPRPILLNNWEATYFDFNADKLEKIAATGAQLGVELFVLDDGWFGHRDDDHTSLGDWVVDRKKLPGGLDDLARRINAQGLSFGLWFEPEMISRDSDLYRAHPDWCLHVPDRARTEGRQQLVLDYSRAEVRNAIYDAIAKILRAAPIRFIKWDMNRHLTEVGSATLPPAQQQEVAHRFVLGLYEIMERFVTEFPEILFEGCSGGGGRFDPGILHYMPQIWTSDNSDAISRLRIQYGTSLAYPLSTLSAHVSAVPNHQVGRVTPMRTRGDVAFTGAFGYELDLGLLSDEEKNEVRRQIESYKKLRPLLLTGDLYRLISPFDGNRTESAWLVAAPDASEALVTHVTILAEATAPHRFLRLRGLDPTKTYRDTATGATYSGTLLQHAGLPIPAAKADYTSHQWHLVAVISEQ